VDGPNIGAAGLVFVGGLILLAGVIVAVVGVFTKEYPDEPDATRVHHSEHGERYVGRVIRQGQSRQVAAQPLNVAAHVGVARWAASLCLFNG